MGLAEIHNIDHTVVFCTDLQAMKLFYRDILGFRIEIEHANWVTFRVGGTRLSLARSESARQPAADKRPALQLAFRVPPSALDQCVEELAGRGVSLGRGPEDIPSWKHRAIFFADPDGNRLEIYAEV
jgi:glyoxylase I family protein